jgi:hypothetical protein
MFGPLLRPQYSVIARVMDLPGSILMSSTSSGTHYDADRSLLKPSHILLLWPLIQALTPPGSS